MAMISSRPLAYPGCHIPSVYPQNTGRNELYDKQECCENLLSYNLKIAMISGSRKKKGTPEGMPETVSPR